MRGLFHLVAILVFLLAAAIIINGVTAVSDLEDSGVSTALQGVVILGHFAAALMLILVTSYMWVSLQQRDEIVLNGMLDDE